MRGARMMGGLVGLVVMVGALAGPGSASAASIVPAGTSFPLGSVTDQVLSISANTQVRCNRLIFSGTSANPASGSVGLTATFGTATGIAGSWCRLYVGGVFAAASVTSSSRWYWNVSTLSSGISNGTMTTGTTSVTVGTCTIALPAGMFLSATGTNFTSPPWGMTLALDAAWLSYTSSGCAMFGIPASGSTATYSGSVMTTSVYVA